MRIMHYASLESNGTEVYGTAELLNGTGYLFRQDGARQATLVSYKDPALMLYGLVDLADAQRAADGNVFDWIERRNTEHAKAA